MNAAPSGVASLCAGYGGLDLAAQAVFGGDLAWYSEVDPDACTLLGQHHPGVRNVGDLTAADWSTATRPRVLTAGWPCQPWSLAGRQAGADDERAIWPGVAAAVRDLRPTYVVLENVSAIARAGELARAVGDLSTLGYLGSWRSVRASDVGAPHRRERIFILAADPDQVGREDGDGGQLRAPTAVGGAPAPDAAHLGHQWPGRPRIGRSGPAHGGGVDSDTVGVRRGTSGRDDGVRPAGLVTKPAPDTDRSPVRQQPVTVTRGGATPRPGLDRRSTADPSGVGQGEGRPEPARQLGGPDAAALGSPDIDWGIYAAAIHRWARVLGRPAPGPTVLGRRGGRQLSPHFVEWLMGLPAGHVTGCGLRRNAQLHLLGNGVVVQQGEHAVRLLLPLVDAAIARAGVAA